MMDATVVVTESPNENEGGCIRQATSGDEKAFALLFHRYYPMIHAYTYRLSLDLSAAEDLAQLTFVKAARGLPQYQPGTNFKSWLYKIATNCFHDWCRRRKREASLQREVALLSAENRHGVEDAVDFDKLHAALGKLPVDQRSAVVLVYLENMNHREAAVLLGCMESTVSWRLHLARRQLRYLLKGMA